MNRKHVITAGGGMEGLRAADRAGVKHWSVDANKTHRRAFKPAQRASAITAQGCSGPNTAHAFTQRLS